MSTQQEMIERVRELCVADSRLVAAMMYGSWTLGEGDAYSDIEFALFFADTALVAIDQRVWVEQIAPVDLYFVNEFGNGTAIFAHLIRGEFHFEPASRMAQVRDWRPSAHFPSLDATLLVDRTGELSEHLATLDRSAP